VPYDMFSIGQMAQASLVMQSTKRMTCQLRSGSGEKPTKKGRTDGRVSHHDSRDDVVRESREHFGRACLAGESCVSNRHFHYRPKDKKSGADRRIAEGKAKQGKSRLDPDRFIMCVYCICEYGERVIRCDLSEHYHSMSDHTLKACSTCHRSRENMHTKESVDSCTEDVQSMGLGEWSSGNNSHHVVNMPIEDDTVSGVSKVVEEEEMVFTIPTIDNEEEQRTPTTVEEETDSQSTDSLKEIDGPINVESSSVADKPLTFCNLRGFELSCSIEDARLYTNVKPNMQWFTYLLRQVFNRRELYDRNYTGLNIVREERHFLLIFGFTFGGPISNNRMYYNILDKCYQSYAEVRVFPSIVRAVFLKYSPSTRITSISGTDFQALAFQYIQTTYPRFYDMCGSPEWREMLVDSVLVALNVIVVYRHKASIVSHSALN